MEKRDCYISALGCATIFEKRVISRGLSRYSQKELKMINQNR